MTNFEIKPHDMLTDPPHAIGVDVVGMGGTGSQVAAILARIDISLRALGHAGLKVKLVDFDTVSHSNIGRQLYAYSEIGLNKAVAMTNRINRFYGLNWEFETRRFGSAYNKKDPHRPPNIVISCVDSVASRMEVKKMVDSLRLNTRDSYGGIIPDRYAFVWLDFGNNDHLGQAILNYSDGKVSTHDFFSLNPGIENEPEDDRPSCSLAEALESQDLLINSTLGNLGMNLLWKIFREKKIQHAGVYLNLKTLKSNPIKLKPLKNDNEKPTEA